MRDLITFGVQAVLTWGQVKLAPRTGDPPHPHFWTVYRVTKPHSHD